MDDDEKFGDVEEAAVKYLPFMSPEQFLEWEEQQEERYEYVDGEIIPVAATAVSHIRISINIAGEIYQFLKGKPCEVLGNKARIAAKSKKSFFYPDATIFCEEPELMKIGGETCINPTVIFEILSPSTDSYDMGKKLFFYMQIDSLKEYIMIDSRKIEIRIGRRQPDNAWKFETLNASSDVLLIQSIGMSLKLTEIYAGVKFN
jgi:Uma2 family endonuclease